MIKSFQNRPGTNAVPAVSTLHGSDTVSQVESIAWFSMFRLGPAKVSHDIERGSACNMVICPLGTEKKYIIHVSRDTQMALNTGMCKISIVNIKKKTQKYSFSLLSPEVQRFHAL